MTAAQFHRYGGPEVLEVATVPRPTPKPGEVLIQVHASAVNSHDAVVRNGKLKIITGRKFPLGIGLDFAGIVVTGDGDGALAPGTAVWGMVSPKTGHRTGAAAQYVVVPSDRVAPMPDQLSMTDAASLVTTGTTALRALKEIARVQPGQRILIRGAAGGVGLAAVQLALAMGADVTALAGAGDLAYLTGLGAHQVLDYRRTRAAQLDRFDLILDTTGTDLLAYRRRLRRRGRMITIVFGSGRALASIMASTVFLGRRVRTFSDYPNSALLTELTTAVAAGAIRPLVDTVYPLDKINDAHRALTESGHRGKLVLTVLGAEHDGDGGA